MTNDAPAETPVLFDERGQLALITLNRPRAINALTIDMVRLVAAKLDEWESNDAIATVAITGAGERGLCAGGDITLLHGVALSGNLAGAAEFWREEYRLNARIAAYAKPVVALMDGITMGGGIGISAHASHRVVTERSKLAMPEVGIGFVPDVGGTWLLSRAPGHLGTHLALTGGTFGAADAIAVGLADSFIEAERLPKLLDALESTDASAALARVATEADVSGLLSRRPWIDTAYATDSVAEVIANLRGTGDEDAAAAASVIESKSPTALTVTLESLRRAGSLASLEEALAVELRVSLRSIQQPDFLEGVRAQVIDKDRNPKWNPATLAEVDAAVVAAHFRPLTPTESPAGELFESRTA